MKISDFFDFEDYHKRFKYSIYIIRHKSNITCILNSNFIKNDKEKELLFTTGYDGQILIWYIEAIEMKLSKLNKQELEESKKKKAEMSKTYNRTEILLSILEYDQETEMTQKYKNEVKNKKTFKFIPTIKNVLDTLKIFKDKPRKKEIYTLCFMSETARLYSGGADGNIYSWNFETANLVNTLVVNYVDI